MLGGASGKVLRRPIPSTAYAWYPSVFGIKQRQLETLSATIAANDPLVQKIQQKKPIRVAVTGGAGAIGYALLFRLANGELLGPDVPVEISAIELPNALNALKGVAMEMDDCAFPLVKKMTCTDNPEEGFDGAEIALLVGSKPRGKGMERADLIRDNGVIFQKTGQTLNKVAEQYCRVTVVGNPCNTNALIACNNAPRLEAHNFTAMTRLDHDRALGFLARKTMLPPNEVNGFAVWGNHSASMFPDLSCTTMHGAPWWELIGEYRARRFWMNELMPKVQQRGARIIEVRGSSSAASAANACIAHTRDWCLGSPQPDWTSMAVVSDGQYGVPSGLVFSYPVYCKGGAYQIVTEDDKPGPNNMRWTQWQTLQEYHIEQNVQELLQERDIVSGLLPN